MVGGRFYLLFIHSCWKEPHSLTLGVHNESEWGGKRGPQWGDHPAGVDRGHQHQVSGTGRSHPFPAWGPLSGHWGRPALDPDLLCCLSTAGLLGRASRPALHGPPGIRSLVVILPSSLLPLCILTPPTVTPQQCSGPASSGSAKADSTGVEVRTPAPASQSCPLYPPSLPTRHAQVLDFPLASQTQDSTAPMDHTSSQTLCSALPTPWEHPRCSGSH